MKRLIIICEGVTERAFCEEVLHPYFLQMDILIESPLIKRSGGGIVSWNALKKQLEDTLKFDRSVYITTLIDFYGIKDLHGYPQWEEEKKTADKNQRMTNLEDAMKKDLADNIRYRFTPYIQLHEFEALLFSDISAFEKTFLADDIDLAGIKSTIDAYNTPEDINNHPDSAPSKRLKAYIPAYSKVLHGTFLALELGLDKIRSKCPRFNQWITILEALGRT